MVTLKVVCTSSGALSLGFITTRSMLRKPSKGSVQDKLFLWLIVLMTNVNIMLKKVIKPSKNKKFVRIDTKTIIEVDEDISDEAAIEKFNKNTNAARKSNSNPYIKYRSKKDKPKPKRKRKARHVLEFGYTSTRDFKRAMLKDEADQDDDMNTDNK